MVLNSFSDKQLLKPEVVLFDTDNTLYEYEPANKAALEASCSKAINLLGITREDFISNYLQARKDIKENLINTASSHSRLLYFQRMIELLGFNAQLLIALDLEQTFWRTFLANAPLFPGVLEVLNLLRSYSIPIGVVTDLTSHIQLRKLTFFGLEDTFDAVVTSEETGADKPNYKNFQLILKKLNLKNDCTFWMIGDNPTSDIGGAKNCGALTFQKLHKGIKLGIGKESPDYSFNEFFELEKFIFDLFENQK